MSREKECEKYYLKIERPTIGGDTAVTLSDMKKELSSIELGQYKLEVNSMNSIGVCKNRKCEYGERLNSGTDWECPADCENVDPICPKVQEVECGEHGLCDRGECDCFEGYTGKDCNECMVCKKGRIFVICRRCFIPNTV